MLFKAHRVNLARRIIAFTLVHNPKERVLLIDIHSVNTKNYVLTASNQDTCVMRAQLSSLAVSAN